MTRILAIIRDLSPGQWLLLVGVALTALGVTGGIMGYEVIEGQEGFAAYAGVALIVIGAGMAYYRSLRGRK